MNIKSITLEISCFKLIIALVIGVLFISQYVPAYADHFTEAEINEGTASIEEEFQEGFINKEEYIEKMAYFSEKHDLERGDREKPEGDFGSLAVISIGIIVAYFFYQRRKKASLINHTEQDILKLSRSDSRHDIGVPESVRPSDIEESQQASIGSEKVADEEQEHSTFFGMRDRSRDNLAEGLRSMGIKAVMAQRGRHEENIRGASGLGRASLGIIDIEDDTIVWINAVRTKSQDKNGPARYRTVFAITDNSIPVEHKAFNVKTTRKKSFPIFGKVVGVVWKSSSAAIKPLIDALSQDKHIEDLVTEEGDITIWTHPNVFQGWTIEISTTWNIFYPSAASWRVIHRIAQILLESPR